MQVGLSHWPLVVYELVATKLLGYLDQVQGKVHEGGHAVPFTILPLWIGSTFLI